ncbi:MAG: hypothetical protein V4561_10060 [Bacteroidota bacterium]
MQSQNSNFKPRQDEDKDLKRAIFLQHFKNAQLISVRTYNSLLRLTENSHFSKDTIVAGLPISNVLLFVERSVKELSTSIYQEMADESYHQIWLDGMSEYLIERFNKIETIEAELKQYIPD